MDRMFRATSTHHLRAGDTRFPYASWRSSAALIAMLLALMIAVPARAAGPAVLVKDITAAVNPSLDSSPKDFVAIGNVIYFTADGGNTGRELWRSDGTSIGTLRITDIVLGPGDASPADLTAVGTTLFFTADDGIGGKELWKSDGTPAGTTRVADINIGPADSSPANLTAIGTTLFFTADNGINGEELWKSTTALSPTLVADLNTGPDSS